MTDTAEVDLLSPEMAALACMCVSNPGEAFRTPGWQKFVNDLIRAQSNEIQALRAKLEAEE